MTLSINQSNYATPAGSYNNLYSADVTKQPYRFLSLADNVLDGSCHPLGGDYVWWGNALSDEEGYLGTPVEIIISGLNESIVTISLTGDAFENNYPVDFTVSTYKDGTLLSTDSVVGNSVPCIAHQISNVQTIDTCIITITRISRANSVAKLVNVYHPYILVRSDAVSLGTVSNGVKSDLLRIEDNDKIEVSVVEHIHITNKMNRLYREQLDVTEKTVPTNVHTVMRAPSRQVFGKVEITYTDPLLDGQVSVSASGTAHGSSVAQASNASDTATAKYFALYDNKLDGTYRPADNSSEVGWWSSVLSDNDGYFAKPPLLNLHFNERPVFSVTIVGDAVRNAYPVDFDILIQSISGTHKFSVKDNSEVYCTVPIDTIPDATGITFVFHRVSRANYPAIVVDVPMSSTVLYESNKLMSINMLEELAYEDETEVLGGISANELTVVLSNHDKSFYFNNPNSPIARQLKKNRKIRAWLGTKIDGLIEWYSLGTYWSHSWDIPIGSLTASVVGFDTIGLLNTMVFEKHRVYVDKSIGYLIDFILEDAKQQFTSLEWEVDPELYEVNIPYCWFEYGSHMAALKRLSLAYPLHVYCNRDGKIIAKVQRMHLEEYYDIWSESTNVISTSYPTLYTALPNHVDVEVYTPVITPGESLVDAQEVFDISEYDEKIITFSNVYFGNIQLEVDCDESVVYAYDIYSWGMIMRFAGSGMVYSIKATGDAITTEVTTMVTKKDVKSIALNGTIQRSVQSELIQTSDRASYIANRIFELSSQDRYDAEVQYRGDIALSIDNPVILKDSIAPINKYNIVRHELHWDGGLSGTATLNT